MNHFDWITRHFDRAQDWALVTGGSSGIGFAFANRLAEAGCNLIILSNDGAQLDISANQLRQAHSVHVESILCDLADYEKVVALESNLSNRRIGILVNNAGFGLKGDFLSIPRSDYRDIVMVNSLAPVLIAQMVLPGMKTRGSGLVVSVASINAVSPIPGNAIYTATKFFTWAAALAVAEENRSSGIIFQLLLPGTTDTPFHVRQGVSPRALTMKPEAVVNASLSKVDALIVIPNWMDRLSYPLVYWMPVRWKMKIAAYSLKKRLGV